MENKSLQQFKKGSLELILLCLIAQKETYGYEIITELNKTGGDIFGGAKEGTIYPILYRLQDSGLLHTRIAPAPANGGEKKYYSLTSEGKRTLRELIDFWNDYTCCVNRFISTAMPEVDE